MSLANLAKFERAFDRAAPVLLLALGALLAGALAAVGV